MSTLALLSPHSPFPSVEAALPGGLLAVGADLSLERLIAAYQHGIFPWFSEGDPILWWSPDPRMVLATAQFKLSRSLAKKCRQIAKQEQAPDARIQIRTDTCFGDVIRHCSHTRAEQGTWITQDIIDAYVRMHEAGYAHSVETWVEGQLVGGLYGICMGRFFFGESMFALQTDASKIALYYLVQFLRANHVPYIDCQQETAHLASLGAAAMPRADFVQLLQQGQRYPAPTWHSGQLLDGGVLCSERTNFAPESAL